MRLVFDQHGGEAVHRDARRLRALGELVHEQLRVRHVDIPRFFDFGDLLHRTHDVLAGDARKLRKQHCQVLQIVARHAKARVDLAYRAGDVVQRGVRLRQRLIGRVGHVVQAVLGRAGGLFDGCCRLHIGVRHIIERLAKLLRDPNDARKRGHLRCLAQKRADHGLGVLAHLAQVAQRVACLFRRSGRVLHRLVVLLDPALKLVEIGLGLIGRDRPVGHALGRRVIHVLCDAQLLVELVDLVLERLLLLLVVLAALGHFVEFVGCVGQPLFEIVHGFPVLFLRLPGVFQRCAGLRQLFVLRVVHGFERFSACLDCFHALVVGVVLGVDQI